MGRLVLVGEIADSRSRLTAAWRSGRSCRSPRRSTTAMRTVARLAAADAFRAYLADWASFVPPPPPATRDLERIEAAAAEAEASLPDAEVEPDVILAPEEAGAADALGASPAEVKAAKD